MTTKSVTYKQVLGWNDDQALDFIESRRWVNGPVCPKCGSCREPYTIRRKVTPETKNKVSRLYRCKDCGKQFTATVGTIFEGSHAPLSTWLAAIFDMVASKKGISAHQIHRKYGITYKAALFMAHRIRHAMRSGSFDKLSGTVEADATFIGGKSRRGHPVKHERIQDEIEMGLRRKDGSLKSGPRKGQPHPRTLKAGVFGMLERGGNVRTVAIERKDESAAELRPVLLENLDPAARLITDSHLAYRRIKDYVRHDRIQHEIAYVDGDVHTQNIEGYWSLLKRGLIGTFHHVSRHRLPMYLGEFEFRFNRRKTSDSQRFVDLLEQTGCGRLRWHFGEQAD